MDIHDSPATTNYSQDNPHLHKETPHFIKRPFQQYKDVEDYDTTRKIPHLNNENEDHNAITPIRKKHQQQQQKSPQIQEEQQQKDQRDPIVTTPLRQKYAHLIPDYQSAEYSGEQKLLLKIQGRLDEHLLYLKTHRGRKRGDFFKSIRCHIIVELTHIKQLLFIDNQLYLCSREKDKENNLDILIDLPNNPDLCLRKAEFKHKLYQYLTKNGPLGPNKANNVVIPLFKFPFEQKIQQSNQLILLRQLQSGQSLEQAKQQQKKLTLKHMFTKDFKFKQTLYQKIVDKENKIKQQSKINPDPKKYGTEQVLKVLDEVHLAYTAKKISNMFRTTLIEIVSKQLNMQEHIVVEILEVVCQHTPSYMKKVNHHKGLILQIDRVTYNEARSTFSTLRL